MKTTRKAMLLSALVLPGLGQLTLKRYKTGIALICAVVISFYRMMSIAMQQANVIVDQLMSQGGALDVQAIASQASGVPGNASYDYYGWIIIACWVISLLDIWRVGSIKKP